MPETEQLYKDYWTNQTVVRENRAYYERLYARIKPKIFVDPAWTILDVAGGNGQLLRFLGVKSADVLDISESGLQEASDSGFKAVFGNVERRFPVPEETYNAAFCFEVLEHLHFPNKTLAEINNSLKIGGVLYVGQPNMRADGVHHVRRYRLRELLDDLKKTGFFVEWVDYVPAYSMRDSILSDIQKNPSWARRLVQCVNWSLSFLPWGVRYRMARVVPDRFALLFIVKASKKEK